MNIGIKSVTSGPIITILNESDYMAPGYISLQLHNNT